MTQHSDSNPADPSQPSRRVFFASGVGVTAAAMAAIAAMEAAAAEENRAAPPAGKLHLEAGQTILFQGDSITDASRSTEHHEANSPLALGKGYAWLAASQLLVDRPEDGLQFFNRGISGNKVYQLAERWQEDCLEPKPDVLSILIGVNDYWAIAKHGYTGTLERYETDYRALVRRTKNALPAVRLVICEPFVLRNPGADEKVAKTWAVDDTWFPDFDGYCFAAKKVANEAGATFVPFQSMFDAAAKIAPPERWLVDGVHPTPDGSALMAQWWLKAVGA
ncbi:MAG TPA: SGNH/GDSL hydrolase family protein [Lacipirellulaceae bacterium]